MHATAPAFQIRETDSGPKRAVPASIVVDREPVHKLLIVKNVLIQ